MGCNQILRRHFLALTLCFTNSISPALNIVLFTTTHNQPKHHTPEIFKLWFGQNISESTEKVIETLRRNKKHNHAS